MRRECTEVSKGGREQDEKEGDKYVLWFVISRGARPSAFVKETYVKSVNGQPMYAWTKTADGTWSATLVPDAAPAAP